MTLDHTAREQMALLIRRFAIGRLSNEAFEESLPNSRDPSINEIHFVGLWPLYDDFIEHKLTGKWALSKAQKRVLARYCLFLKSDLPYEWSKQTGIKAGLFLLADYLISGGLFGFVQHKLWLRQGDAQVWPFFRQEDFDNALKHPKYFSKS